MTAREFTVLVLGLALLGLIGQCQVGRHTTGSAHASRIRSGSVRATPAPGEWILAQQDPAADLPSENYRDLVVNKARPVTIEAVCCYANAPGAAGQLIHRNTSVGQATAALPTPAACATPGWSGTDGCVAANEGVATNDGIDWNYTTQTGVTAIRVVLRWLAQ